MKEYTHPPIYGKLPSSLPQGNALVLEGGGTRCAFTAGVLDHFLANDILFPYTIGVSAGACAALSYLAGQEGRNREMLQYHMPKPEYMGFARCLKGKSFLNNEYVFEEMPNKHLYFHWENFQQNQVRFLTGSYDCESGTTHWFEKEEIDPKFTAMAASSNLPFVSPTLEFQGKKWLDGGILDPIPLEKSLADGNEFHVIVLTQNKGYRKKKLKNPITKFWYPAYPKLSQALNQRYENYNRQIELCEEWERQGKALIIRPMETLEMSGAEQNPKHLLHLYEQGRQAADYALAGELALGHL